MRDSEDRRHSDLDHQFTDELPLQFLVCQPLTPSTLLVAT